MTVTIKEVTTKKDLRKFITFPYQLYKDSKYYVPPLISQEMNTLCKEKNPAFEFCEARYWLAYRENKIVGRIAGIINQAIIKKYDKNVIRFGWFDFIEDEVVVRSLLKTVEDWGRQTGAVCVNGPLGFISFDPTGVLVKGFDEMPTSFATYNFPYYDTLINNCGYVKDADWVEFQVIVPQALPERIIKASRAIGERYKLKNIPINTKKEALYYGKMLFELLNNIYRDLPGYIELTPKVREKVLKDFTPLIDPGYLCLITNDKEEPVAFGISTPSLSKALQKAKGKMFPFGFIHLMKALKKNDVADLLIIGVKPEYVNKGVYSLIFEKTISSFIRNGVKTVEITRTLEANSKLTKLWDDYDHRLNKVARVYLKQLTDEK